MKIIFNRLRRRGFNTVLIIVTTLVLCLSSIVISPIADDTDLVEINMIDSPPTPSLGRNIVDTHALPRATVILNNVPTSEWTYGCTATSAGMLFGYYDRTTHPNMYTGPTNGSVCPLTDLGQGVPGNPRYPITGSCYIIATENSLDGIGYNAHVEDYYIGYPSPGPDPWVTNGWTEHTIGLCTADYLGTNQWKWDFYTIDGVTDANFDGSTTYYTNADGTKLFDYIPPLSQCTGPGSFQTACCHGLRLFAESRGYSVSTNYNQLTNTPNGHSNGFTFQDFKNEIDNGYPVITHWTTGTAGHTMLGVGYDDTSNTIYFHDTWDNNLHSCPWTGQYSSDNYELRAVSVIHLGTLGDDREYGDAPEGDNAVAYPSTMVYGSFPTCKTCGPAGYIEHNNFGAFFGPMFDFETEGNAGLCPTCFPTYDDDECYQDGDAGLLIPDSFTIDSAYNVVPCQVGMTTPLGQTGQPAVWGVDVDIEVHNHMPSATIGFVNVLMDWNQDGDWQDAGEHVLVDQMIPNPFDGPISNLIAGTSFTIGPNPGYVWTRFSITESQVGAGWNGTGVFEDGETEDYLLNITTYTDPWEHHKMHFPQLPDPFGWDVLSNWEMPFLPLADDWMCTESGPVTDIHFWGSWFDDAPTDIDGFDISIWDDIPADVSPTGYSMPGTMLWNEYFNMSLYQITPMDPSPQGWYDPYSGSYMMENHMMYFRYDIVNISNPFIQENGTIYWLCIRPNVIPNSYPMLPLWGWKTSIEHFNDDAVYWLEPDGWMELYDPITGLSLDLSFVITGEPGLIEREYGDAPEGLNAIAYPSTMVTGAFPTCKCCGPAGYIEHNNFGAFFGPMFEFETEGNAGLCPTCFPPYDADECYQDGDAGLLIPDSFTIDSAYNVVPCQVGMTTALGQAGQPAVWGVDVDIEVHNHMPSATIGFVNVLMDWNQDGDWQDAGEHVLVDQMIPNPFDGPISALIGGTAFTIGPNPGYVWCRFTITEFQLGAGWYGEGVFEDGETEDYLMKIDDPPIYAEYGDAPENALAYPSGVIGQFPTCVCCGPAGFVRHHMFYDGLLFLGNSRDIESDGNAGLCPIYPPYDQDEGFFPGPDGGLMIPDIYTFDAANNVVLLAALGLPELGFINDVAMWGGNIDLFVQNLAFVDGFVNVLADWNQNGQWGDSGEHILINQPIPAGFTGPLSFLSPPPFVIGPNDGYIWFRCTITPMPITPDWNGEGEREDGETEDYLLLVREGSPVASFTVEPINPVQYETVYFNSTSTDPNGVIVNWTWNIDGIMKYGEFITHQFTTDGPKIVSLTVMDNDGNTDSTAKLVPVGDIGQLVTGIKQGWNLITNPTNISVIKTDLFIKYNGYYYSWSQATTTNNPTGSALVNNYMFGWDRTYQYYTFADYLTPGEGIWFFSYVDDIELWSMELAVNTDDFITHMQNGWNLVGNPHNESLAKTSLEVIYGGTTYSWAGAVSNSYVSNFIFGWDRSIQSYNFANTLYAGESYWIYSYVDCSLYRS